MFLTNSILYLTGQTMQHSPAVGNMCLILHREKILNQLQNINLDLNWLQEVIFFAWYM